MAWYCCMTGVCCAVVIASFGAARVAAIVVALLPLLCERQRLVS
jgi:hypothetical protein